MARGSKEKQNKVFGGCNMIFFTVGTQLPFDRLTMLVDEFCRIYPDETVFGQIGDGDYQPKHFDFINHISISEFDKKFSDAEAIISHAGMGTIITSLVEGKPIIVSPRVAALGEHRNEHQLSTVNRFQSKENFYVIEAPSDLIPILANVRTKKHTPSLSQYAPTATLVKLKKIIAQI
ncbi:MAG: UDP-N-acetylglucosamine transferase subunit ALG13 [Psychroserpens sp.]|jgi:UDP-N-acetylglucosamine transferase subunit ALG13